MYSCIPLYDLLFTVRNQKAFKFSKGVYVHVYWISLSEKSKVSLIFKRCICQCILKLFKWEGISYFNFQKGIYVLNFFKREIGSLVSFSKGAYVNVSWRCQVILASKKYIYVFISRLVTVPLIVNMYWYYNENVRTQSIYYLFMSRESM